MMDEKYLQIATRTPNFITRTKGRFFQKYDTDHIIHYLATDLPPYLIQERDGPIAPDREFVHFLSTYR